MDLERVFLQILEQSGITFGLGDDGVALPCFKNPIYMLDLFTEGVHFKKEWFTLEQIGYKAIAVNISDAIALCAVPKYALLGLQLPENFSPLEIKELIQGLKKACQEFKIQIVGGDTIVSKSLSLAITLLASSAKPLLRQKMRLGDLLVHTGRLGESNKALQTLLRGGKIPSHFKFYKPALKNLAPFMQAIRPFLHAGLDISDGLLAECNRLSQLNQLHCKLTNPHQRAFLSGEEYEMLLCLPARNKHALIQRAKKYRIKLSFVGRVVRGKSRYKAKIWHRAAK
ncbi:thiamine-phosphate kinase [Helicobacter suis]|uniref:thiamine-phosphate kinase n=1 Tax=Helicobacter suis TaxID=104628 RepID=UPI0013D29950|nr:thiamine-phosphate kinase [Helicobacter suis]